MCIKASSLLKNYASSSRFEEKFINTAGGISILTSVYIVGTGVIGGTLGGLAGAINGAKIGYDTSKKIFETIPPFKGYSFPLNMAFIPIHIGVAVPCAGYGGAFGVLFGASAGIMSLPIATVYAMQIASQKLGKPTNTIDQK